MVRRWQLWTVAIVGLVAATPAWADRIAEPAAAMPRVPAGTPSVAPSELEPDPATVPVTGSRIPPREMLRNKPSGFWTSNAPARHGAYRYRMLLIGVGVFAISLFFVIRALRKASAARARS